ncbi:hypothetical protein BJ875DRAFT_437845 [Amylocarpus encephaloides]|uniref:Uncharacterized protein n=1 Tax=Amylocarpus encephaloides TaxID=45428 RepID=A0A9P7YRG1_9HELO|nr:hypothetical protein BJ875DRAFT_437845 [Amylocarpus encephaloides]
MSRMITPDSTHFTCSYQMERIGGHRNNATSILSNVSSRRTPLKRSKSQGEMIQKRSFSQGSSPPPSAELQAPIVNSSLMFFSSRPYSESLAGLANSPELAPRALEILFRNWKGPECLPYAYTFLQNAACCAALLGPNWTCWYGDDQTLFDLAHQKVARGDQKPLFKALLKADLTFRPPLASVRPLWANSWRLATQQEDWSRAKTHLTTLGAGRTLQACALSVMAEHFLERYRAFARRKIFDVYDGLRMDYRGKYMEVLKDSLEMGIEVRAEWFDCDKMFLEGVGDGGTSGYLGGK